MMAAAITALAASCIAVEGDRIFGRDLAPALPGLAEAAPDAPLGFAPLPGTRRVFGLRELERLARQHGLPPAASPVCLERRMEPLSREQVESALRAAAGPDAVRIEILDYSRAPVAKGTLQFPRTGLSSPGDLTCNVPVTWRGSLRYSATGSLAVWARVRLAVTRTRCVSATALKAGETVQGEQVRTETIDAFPFGPRPCGIEQIVGRRVRRSLQAGTEITAALLDEPKQVERGQMVSVEVSSGAAQLSFEARAESGGNAGDGIVLVNPSTGRRFAAKVEGRGKAIVNAIRAESHNFADSVSRGVQSGSR
jgi:flagella basal body P-ring formation protein FlgA